MSLLNSDLISGNSSHAKENSINLQLCVSVCVCVHVHVCVCAAAAVCMCVHVHIDTYILTDILGEMHRMAAQDRAQESLSTVVLNSRDWWEIVWLPKISRFKINLAIGQALPKKTALVKL